MAMKPKNRSVSAVADDHALSEGQVINLARIRTADGAP
jgi:hypothetical protein